ncbi:dTDP-glucose 4,6-dehydratase [Ruaniaceae bacterium KH17]|nr:dTDP-glucose 4,6-dehydratase [Ruaniaceae bacterium KH17]
MKDRSRRTIELFQRTGIPVGRIFYVVDAILWVITILIAATLRYEFDLSRINWSAFAAFSIAAVALQFVIGSILNLYRAGLRLRLGTFEDALTIALTSISVGGLLWLVSLVLSQPWGISRGVMVIATPFAMLAMLAARVLTRLFFEHAQQPGSDSQSALILGAGFIGTNLVHWMKTDPRSPYRPVGLIDDDPLIGWRSINNVPILGTRADLRRVAAKSGAEVLIVAIGNADAALLREIQDLANECGLTVKVMPPIGQVVANGVRADDLRDLSIEDLLGRQAVDTNVSEIADYLTGRRVLVTGAGGSIGAQLCTEITRFGPTELIMLDRDETGLQHAQINTAGNGLLNTDDVVLADIRDADTLIEIFKARKPEVVFHAAALKHLPMLEQYPDEAWKTNVLGTLNVLRAAEAAGVTTFINISTDKAANPTSVLGYSKRVAEKLTSWFGQSTGKKYLSVRFGNVIGSRGSMLPTFMRLIDEDKPLTVTHPDITRYFMTIPEACQLVLQAGGIGRVGEVLILDMGEPVKILDIAQRMVAMSGKDIQIVFTGLREGAKMHEELVGSGEHAERPFHPKISHATVTGIAPDKLDKHAWDSRVHHLTVAIPLQGQS